MKRSLFIISDGTGITAAALAHSLLAQFSGIQFEETILPYVNTLKKTRAALKQINQSFKKYSIKPLVFSSLVNPVLRDIIASSDSMVLDFFKAFVAPLEVELNQKSARQIGKTHGQSRGERYDLRIDAINFTLETDDGLHINGYDQADIILLGVSRSAKTPTCLYLAMQFGIFAANYPITEEDLQNGRLPDFLLKYQKKCYGLTIEPERLQQIRHNRLPGSRYASPTQCHQEVHAVEVLFTRYGIPYLNSTTRSIEEIATTIIAHVGLRRKLF